MQMRSERHSTDSAQKIEVLIDSISCFNTGDPKGRTLLSPQIFDIEFILGKGQQFCAVGVILR